MRDPYLLSSNTYQVFRLSDLKLLGTHWLDPGPTGNGHVAPEEARVAADGSVYIQTALCGIHVPGRSHQLGIGFDGSIYPATRSETLIVYRPRK
jgi:hypothetical protein